MYSNIYNIDYNNMFVFRVNHTNDKKHGECSLFSSLQFPSHENQLASYENQIPNSLPLTINNIITDNDDKSNVKENIKEVCSNFVLNYLNIYTLFQISQTSDCNQFWSKLY